MGDPLTFKHYYRLAEGLIEQSSKEELAQCARLLAIYLAHHETLHGEIPMHQTLAVLRTIEPNDAQSQLLTRGIENLVEVLGNVMDGPSEQKH